MYLHKEYFIDRIYSKIETSHSCMTTQHISGPWKYNVDGGRVETYDDKQRHITICDIRGWGYLTGKGHGALGLDAETARAIQDANAHLIAAAPELLAALKHLAGDRYQKLYGDCKDKANLTRAMLFWTPSPEKRARKHRCFPPASNGRDLLRKSRQAGTAAHIEGWLNSPGLQRPK